MRMRTKIFSEESISKGPGSYNHTGYLSGKKPPSYSMGLRNWRTYTNDTPGPGSYKTDRSTVSNIPSSRIGNSKRADLASRLDTPGVGNYNLRNKPGSGPEYGFGSESKDRPKSAYLATSYPGPGTYQLKSTIDPKKGAFTLVSRKPDLSVEKLKGMPGPGHYSPEKLLSKSNIRFPLKERDPINSKNEVPGPGSYEPLFTMRSEKFKSPAIGMGTSQRRPMSANTSYPAPGTYNIRGGASSGPRWIMSSRASLQNFINKLSPGPGAYTPSYSQVLEKAPDSNLKGGSKYDAKNDDVPGPGFYDVRGKFKGPKWGFGTEIRKNDGKDNYPGPGTYRLKPTFADVPQYLLPNQESSKYSV